MVFLYCLFSLVSIWEAVETSWVGYKKLGQQCVLFLIGGWSIGELRNIMFLIKEHKLCYLNYSKG